MPLSETACLSFFTCTTHSLPCLDSNHEELFKEARDFCVCKKSKYSKPYYNANSIIFLLVNIVLAYITIAFFNYY